MGADRTFGRIVPPIGAVGRHFGMERVDELVVGPACLAGHQQMHLGIGIDEDSMGEAIAGGKAHGIAGAKAVEHAIEPDIWRTLEHIDEFLLCAFGMRARQVVPAGKRS